MKSTKERLPVRTEKQKQKAFRDSINKHLGYVKKQMNRELVTLYLLEMDGGKCLSCKNEWKKVEFNNSFGAGFYYRPTCKCYFHCDNCDTPLYIEQISGKLKARDFRCKCGFQVVKPRKDR